MDANPAGMFILIAVLIIAVVGVIVLVAATRNAPRLNVTHFQTKWLEIENSLDRNNRATWELAIFNADKLVDQALKERRIKGKTMGERMKTAQKMWRNANYVWSAHKLRNQLAHETDVVLSYELTSHSLAAFKQALKDLGAI